MEGRYPKIFLEGSEEDWLDVRPGDMEIVKAPLDFIGINLYTRMTIAYDPHDKMMGTHPAYHGEENELTDFGWEVYPQALSQMILRNRARLSGHADSTSPRRRIIRREARHRRQGARSAPHPLLAGIHRRDGTRDREGADVRGYFLWTFTDNFEWAEGFQQRFGIVYCDFETQQRYIKDSGHWYSQLARTTCSISILASSASP